MQRHNYPRHPDENIPQSFIQNNLGFEIPENKGSTGKDSVWAGSKPSCQLIILITLAAIDYIGIVHLVRSENVANALN